MNGLPLGTGLQWTWGRLNADDVPCPGGPPYSWSDHWSWYIFGSQFSTSHDKNIVSPWQVTCLVSSFTCFSKHLTHDNEIMMMKWQSSGNPFRSTPIPGVTFQVHKFCIHFLWALEPIRTSQIKVMLYSKTIVIFFLATCPWKWLQMSETSAITQARHYRCCIWVLTESHIF